MRYFFSCIILLFLTSCISSPYNNDFITLNSPLRIEGFSLNPGVRLKLEAFNQKTLEWDQLATTTSSTRAITWGQSPPNKYYFYMFSINLLSTSQNYMCYFEMNCGIDIPVRLPTTLPLTLGARFRVTQNGFAYYNFTKNERICWLLRTRDGSGGVNAYFDCAPEQRRELTLWFRYTRPIIKSLTANPVAINPGECSILAWQTVHHAGARFSFDQIMTPISANKAEVCPLSTTTYTLTVVDSYGFNTKSVTVYLRTQLTLTASDTTVTPGSPVALKWTLNNLPIGSVAALTETINGITSTLQPDIRRNDSLVVMPIKTTTYTLSVPDRFNPGQTISQSVTIEVDQSPQIASFTANPPRILQQESSTLDWNVSSANSISITPSVSTIPLTSTGQATVSPSVTTTYTLTAENDYGISSKDVTVTVLPNPNIPRPGVDCDCLTVGTFFDAKPALIFSNANPPATVTTQGNAIKYTTPYGRGNIELLSDEGNSLYFSLSPDFRNLLIWRRTGLTPNFEGIYSLKTLNISNSGNHIRLRDIPEFTEFKTTTGDNNVWPNTNRLYYSVGFSVAGDIFFVQDNFATPPADGTLAIQLNSFRYSGVTNRLVWSRAMANQIGIAGFEQYRYSSPCGNIFAIITNLDNYQSSTGVEEADIKLFNSRTLQQIPLAPLTPPASIPNLPSDHIVFTTPNVANVDQSEIDNPYNPSPRFKVIGPNDTRPEGIYVVYYQQPDTQNPRRLTYQRIADNTAAQTCTQ